MPPVRRLRLLGLGGGGWLHDGNELHELHAVVAKKAVDAPRMVAVAPMNAADCLKSTPCLCMALTAP